MDFARDLSDILATPWEAISLGWCLHLLTFALVAFHCLRNRREPTSALLWLFIAWFLPGLGPLLYLAFGIYKVPAKGMHKHKADQRLLAERRALEDSSLALTYWRSVHETRQSEPDSPAARDLNRTMDSILEEYPLLGGNEVRLLLNGTEAYPAMLEAIRRARHHIHLQCFLIRDDPVGREFLEALAERARAGVRVRLLYDRFGSTHAVLSGLFRRYRAVPNFTLVCLTQANPLKRQFQINLRNHRKILIVDGQEAFAGGMNLHAENCEQGARLPIRDYHFALRGPVIQELQFVFLRDWYFMTNEPPDALLKKEHFPALPACGSALIRVVNGGPSSRTEVVSDVFFLAMIAARRQLWMVTPYFAPPPDLLHALRSATLRGVDVRLVVPRTNNHVYAGLAGRALYDELLDSGVRVYERRTPFMHAKAVVVDDTLVLVGTANLDVRSLRLNYETDLAVYGATFIETMKGVIQQEMALSDEINLAVWRTRPLRQRLMENFCSLLSPSL